MTCIVGLVDEGIVYIGGDRGASDGTSIVSMSQSKVGINEHIVYGYCGTIGIGQMIEFISLPPCKDEDPYAYIRLILVEELKNAIESFSREGTEHDTTWLIGCQGHLYELSSQDWSVMEIQSTAVGSGGNFALGSIYTSIDKEPIDRLGLALGAAITYSPNCQGPIDIIYM